MKNKSFIAASFLAMSTLLAIATPSMAMRPGQVVGRDQGTSVNMRSGPSTGNRIVASTYVGNSIVVLSETTGRDGYIWYNVDASGNQGWVRGDFVGMNRECSQYAMLNGDGPGDVINVRSGPSRSNAVRREAAHGDHVRILSYRNASDGYRWFQVRFHSGTEGWVRGDLVKFG